MSSWFKGAPVIRDRAPPMVHGSTGGAIVGPYRVQKPSASWSRSRSRGSVSAVVTGLQIRAAGGFLAWDRRDLAKKAVVTIYTIERIETGAEISGTAMVKGLAAVQAALAAEGIEFTDNKGVLGVRLHPKEAQGEMSEPRSFGSLSAGGHPR
jgi:hypothetical protein